MSLAQEYEEYKKVLSQLPASLFAGEDSLSTLQKQKNNKNNKKEASI